MTELPSLDRTLLETTLKLVLITIKEREDEGDYRKRNLGVMTALSLAYSLDYPVRVVPWDDAHENDLSDEFRTVVYIKLPTGLVSWHLPTFELIGFDGRTTEEKYTRCQAYIDGSTE